MAPTDLTAARRTVRFADVVLPATAWLEEVGSKSTNTHLYLMDRALDPPGETRALAPILKDLARRLGLPPEFYPWASDDGPLDAILDHPSTGRATVAALRAEGGIRPLRVGHVAHADLVFATPSGKIARGGPGSAGRGARRATGPARSPRPGSRR